MAFASGGGKRRVFPLQVQAHEEAAAAAPAVVTPSAAQRSLVAPKSPLHGAVRSTAFSQRGGMGGMGGMDRMLLLRNMNVSVAISGAEPSAVKSPGGGASSGTFALPAGGDDVSAAHNLKTRKQQEARRRVEVQLMTLEDYVNTPEGDARLRRQDERARMQEEELRTQRVVQHEKAARRAEQLQKQQEDEARMREMYLSKRRQDMEEQERLAKEKEVARKLALEAKMKALKEEADRKAREEYAARQKKLEDEAQAEREVRAVEIECAAMHVEEVLAVAIRVEWLAEVERQKQIEAEAFEWKLFEEREAERQRDETQRRREAQKEHYEEDRRRRMQIHKLQQDRVRTAAGKRRQQEQQSEGVTVVAAATTSLQRLRSQWELSDAPPPILIPSPVLPNAAAAEESATREQFTARRPPPLETARTSGPVPPLGLNVIVDQPPAHPPPVFDPGELVVEPPSTSTTDPANMLEPTGPDLEGASALTIPAAVPAFDSIEAPPPVASETELIEPPSIVAPAEDAGDVQIAPEVLSLEKLRFDGVTPMAEVLRVSPRSPAAVAGLAARDLVLDFGGVTSSTPKCIIAIAECVQHHVNQSIVLVVLRPNESDPSTVQRCTLQLVPCKWKGKGLLGCQLSPFKWPTTASNDDINVGESTGSSLCYEPLVLYQVQPDSLAYRLGIVDGDVLARCGDMDLVAQESGKIALAAVATYFQTQWRDAQRELTVTIQRWDAMNQTYAVIHATLPVSIVAEPLGCALTTYNAYYYPTRGAGAASPACDECCNTSLASSLHAAALSGHIECLDSLLATCGSEFIDWRDDEGRSPLFYACYASQAAVVEWLIARLGAYDPIYGADANGDSPLHAAAASDCIPAVEILLNSRYIADVNLVNATTQATAAHVAASEAVLRLLHDRYSVDLLALDADGRMPLFYACLRNDTAAVAFLCSVFPDFADYADSVGGNTPLHMAAWCGFVDVVRTLLLALPAIALFVPNQDGLDPRALAEQSGQNAVVYELERAMMQSRAL